MKTYLVGGAVRDTLLGLPVKDRDWVVVGATPRQLTDHGFTPVGKDFPVFLHPRSKQQYALARTERKTAPGYRGFTIHAAPDVTLEQDLARRDLTINAMALDAALLPANGDFDPARVDIIDPHQGQRDLHDRILRHVSAAFREDPVRILRVARFAARFSDFQVAPETMDLMRAMVAEGEAAALVPERVWQELARGLMENMPSRMFALLQACGALSALLPELSALWQTLARLEEAPTKSGFTQAHTMRALDCAAQMQSPLPVRFASLFSGASPPTSHGKGPSRQDPVQQLCQRIRVPVECRELAELVYREAAAVDACMTLDARALLLLLERADAFRKPARFADLLQVCACHAHAATDAQGLWYPQRDHLLAVLAAAQAVSTETVATRAQAAGISGKQVGDMIHSARLDAVATVLRA